MVKRSRRVLAKAEFLSFASRTLAIIAVCSPRRFLGSAKIMKQPASIASIREKVDSFCPRMCRKCGSAVKAEVLLRTGLVMLRRIASEASLKRLSKYERSEEH